MSSSSSSSNNPVQFVFLGLAAATALFFVWRLSSTQKSVKQLPDRQKELAAASDRDAKAGLEEGSVGATTAASSTTSPEKSADEKAVHAKIEELDKAGKKLFQQKQYMEAAAKFTEALDLISQNEMDAKSSHLARQRITLMNNRSAMYEKANLPELALEDCNTILEKEEEHDKARKRKLRTLEILHRWEEALVECCAIQLLFMKANRHNLSMGIPMPAPPIPQSKIEDLIKELLPAEVEKYVKRLKEQKKRPLPSVFTIYQLLRTYSGYNAWMAKAAKDGSAARLTASLAEATDTATTAQRATMLMKRGRRYVYDKEYAKASADFEEAFALVGPNEDVQQAMEEDSYARLLEWTGMVRHWHYDLDSALTCYQECAEIEPTNPSLLVKQAGVQMDAGKHDEAMKLFDTALGLDSTAVDALFHRSNLKMLQGQPEDARKDLERILELRPNYVMARLRLASILAAMDDVAGAKRHLDLAEQEEPNSGEIMSYRGELAFIQGQVSEAKDWFDKAIELEPTNPTPYVNAAMAILNSQPEPGKMPDITAAIDLLEKAIETDPQFTAAYMQLGQLVLGTATDLKTAGTVIKLYDRALENCRTEEEIKELVSMRLLAVGQVEAATQLKMKMFKMG